MFTPTFVAEMLASCESAALMRLTPHTYSRRSMALRSRTTSHTNTIQWVDGERSSVSHTRGTNVEREREVKMKEAVMDI